MTLFKTEIKNITQHLPHFHKAEDIAFILNFDKGNNSSEVFTEIDASKLTFIASIRPSMVKDLATIPAQNFQRFILNNGKEVGVMEFQRELYGQIRQLIIEYTPDQAKRTGENLLKKLEKEIEEIQDFFQTRMNVKKWRSLEAVKKKIATMISDLHQSLISVNLIEAKDKISLDLSIDHAALTSHVSTLGKSYLISNHPSKSAEEIVQLFRQQITVEQVFSYLKSPDLLRARPILAQTESSIRGHLFSCVLGLLLLTLLTREIRKTYPELTLEAIIEILSTVKAMTIQMPGSKKVHKKLARLSPEAENLVNLLNLSSYL